MNCLYITLFFNIVAGIVQIFIESRNQLLYPRVIEVYRQPFETRYDSSCTSSSSSNFSPASSFFRWRNKWKSLACHKQQKCVFKFTLNVHLLRWEIVWRNAPRIWWDFGSALPFQTRLTQTKPVTSLWNEHGSQVKNQGRRQCCHNKHKNFSIGLHVMYLYFPDTPLTFSPSDVGWSHFVNDIEDDQEIRLPLKAHTVCARSTTPSTYIQTLPSAAKNRWNLSILT